MLSTSKVLIELSVPELVQLRSLLLAAQSVHAAHVLKIKAKPQSCDYHQRQSAQYLAMLQRLTVAAVG